MNGRQRLAMLLAVAAVSLAAPRIARADAVDDAFAEGNAAAKAGRWNDAIVAYERAADLLPATSDVLSYDLGTAYAHVGRLGPATYHLRRSLRETSDPALREAARRNLGVVRRRAELSAATVEARISPPLDWRDRLWGALGSAALGIVGIVFGWICVVLAGARWVWTRRTGQAPLVVTPLLVALGVSFGAISLAHALAIRIDPEAIVLDDVAAVYEGPGRHRTEAFSVQGGSSVRIVGQAPGWHQIRMKGGLGGWVPDGTLGRLDRVQTTIRGRSPSAQVSGDADAPSP